MHTGAAAAMMPGDNVHARILICVTRAAFGAKVLNRKITLGHTLTDKVRAVIIEFTGWIDCGDTYQILCEGNQLIFLCVYAAAQVVYVDCFIHAAAPTIFSVQTFG